MDTLHGVVDEQRVVSDLRPKTKNQRAVGEDPLGPLLWVIVIEGGEDVVWPHCPLLESRHHVIEFHKQLERIDNNVTTFSDKVEFRLPAMEKQFFDMIKNKAGID